MSHIPWDHDAGAFLIYVDECQDGVLSGRFYYPFKGESGSFRDLMQLVLKLEHSMNWEEAPQSFSALRSFSPLMSLKKDKEQSPPRTILVVSTPYLRRLLTAH